jgi:hypothetical protein
MFHQSGANVANEREKLLENTDDIKYSTIWSVGINDDGSISKIELRYVADFPSYSIVKDFKLSEAFVRNAEKQIKNMEWQTEKNGGGAIVEQTAICYLLKSNPDEPQCSNNLER